MLSQRWSSTVAYVSPFFGSLFLNINEITFLVPVTLIIVFNCFISKELAKTEWNKYFVSPRMHIKHHKVRNRHYSAPIINIDRISE